MVLLKVGHWFLKDGANNQNIIISWDKPNLIDNGHYQRFLFRLKHFSQDFNSWFSIDRDCQTFLDDLKIKQAEKYLLNIQSKRGDKVSPNPEADLEDRFVNKDLREPLMNISNATSLYRQLPVGVFENKVSKKVRQYLQVAKVQLTFGDLIKKTSY